MGNNIERFTQTGDADFLAELLSWGGDEPDAADDSSNAGVMTDSGEEAPPPTGDDWETPGDSIAGIKLLKKIGQGGMGIVYLAEQRRPLRRRVAVKIIKPGLDSSTVITRFKAERQALAIMDHPNIAHVFDAGVSDSGRPYFVMEYVDGLPITRFCDKKRLTIRERAALFVPICLAIQHAHQKQVVHRDLKPSNVLVTLADDSTPMPKVIDFGVAKALNQELGEGTLTQVGGLVGTLEYMSPEQADMTVSGTDPRSDVYSLGVMLYELLTGTTPFDGAQLRQAGCTRALRVIQEQDPLPPSACISSAAAPQQTAALRGTGTRKLARSLVGDLDRVIMKCLEKQPDRRYQTAGALAQDLRRYLLDQPVEARSPSALYRLKKLADRHRVSLRLVGGLAAFLLIAVVTIFWQGARVLRAHQEVMRHRQAELDALALVARQSGIAEARRAEAEGEVMRALLPISGPGDRNGGPSMLKADLLDRVSRAMDSRFVGQPQAEIEAREALAVGYQNLAMHRQAGANFQRAYELSCALPGGMESNQSLRLAAKYAFYVDEAFANRTYQTALKKWGEKHPVTLDAASSYANQLLVCADHSPTRFDDARRAEQMLRAVVAEVAKQPAFASGPWFYRHTNRLVSALNTRHEFAEAAALARAAIERGKADRNEQMTARGPLGYSLTGALMGQGKFQEALTVAAETFDYDRQNIGDFHSNTRRMLKRYVEVLRNLGRADQGERLLEQHLELARGSAGDDEAVIDLLTALANARVKSGKGRAAVPLLVESAQIQERRNTELEKENDDSPSTWLCEAVLLSLGASEHPGGSLSAQMFCALEELWRDNPFALPDPDAIIPSDVHFSLSRWNGSDQKIVATGTLADTVNDGQHQPGLCVLTMDVPTPQGPRLRHASWIVLSDWELMFHPTNRLELEGPPAIAFGNRVDGATYLRLAGLALMNDLKDPPARTTENLYTAARTTLDLPPGRYRFSTTAVDGVRLFVDGRRAVNDWIDHRPQRNTKELSLEGGRHLLEVEHYERGDRGALWLTVRPLSAAADSITAAAEKTAP